MIRSTPRFPTTQATPFAAYFGNSQLFAVQPGVRVTDALAFASDYLACAAATAYESADNATPEFRQLARTVIHQIEAAKALVDASLAGLDQDEEPPATSA